MGESYMAGQAKHKNALPSKEYEELAETLPAKTQGKGRGKKRRKYDETHYAYLVANDLERVMTSKELRDLSLRLQKLSASNETHWLDELFDGSRPERTRERRDYLAKLLRQAAG